MYVCMCAFVQEHKARKERLRELQLQLDARLSWSVFWCLQQHKLIITMQTSQHRSWTLRFKTFQVPITSSTETSYQRLCLKPLFTGYILSKEVFAQNINHHLATANQSDCPVLFVLALPWPVVLHKHTVILKVKVFHATRRPRSARSE